MALLLLRDQPGVEALEWEVEQHPPDPAALPELRWFGDTLVEEEGRLIDRIDNLALQLFGVNRHDTAHLDAEPFDEVWRMFRDEADAWWASHGWDITDGKGNQLHVMRYFLEPMIAMVKQLHPDARSPRLAEAWGARLEEEARRFKPSRLKKERPPG